MTENADDAPGRIRAMLVDDDDLFRESLEQNLADSGISVTGFSNGPAALEFLVAGGDADLILLDWKMPEMNGIEVLKRLRDIECDIPVIFLTVLSDQIYEEAALLGGAVDFVEKSRSFAILMRRIELILAGTKSTKAEDAPGQEDDGTETDRPVQRKEYGELTLAQDSSRAFWKGKRLDLTLTEFKMVQYMASNAGKDVRYRELYDLVHGEGFAAGIGDEGYRANVRTFIKRIRQKFRAADDDFDAIENYPGFGYRWRIDGPRHG